MNSVFVLGARDPFGFFEKLYRGQISTYVLKDYMPKPRRRKKSKYKHIVIKNKKYYFYKIKWVDITGDSGHATQEEFEKFMPSEMITYGYIFKKDRKNVWTFSSYDTTDVSFSDRNVFPLGCIKKMEKMSI